MANLSNINNKFLVTTGGNVGINVTSPTTGRFVVNTTSGVAAAFGRDGTDGDVVQIYNGVAGTTKVVALGASGNDGTIYSQYGDLLLQPAAGNVGIGETDPSGYWGQANNIVIDTSGNGGITIKSTSAGNGRLVFTDTKSATAGNTDGGMIAYNHTDDEMRFQTNGGQRIVIDSSGNVGIGATPNDWDPTITALQIDAVSISAFLNNVMLISGNAYYDDTANAYKYINDGFASQLTVNNSGNFEFKTAGSGTAGGTVSLDTKVKILNNGNVGIGRTPDVKILDLQSTSGLALRFYNSATFKAGIEVVTTAGQMIGSSAVNDLAIRSQSNMLFATGGNTERMRIDSSGEVLVGVTYNQTESPLTSRNNGSSIEFGHLNQTSGYYGTVGSMYSNGTPFISFSCDSSATSAGNNFATRGFKGNVIHGDTGGNLIFSQATNANSASQTLTERMRIDSSGNVMMGKTSQSGNAALTVRSTAGGNTGIILVEGDTTNDGWGVYAVTANEYRITRFTNGSYSDKFIITSGGDATFTGNVGIGGAPSVNLEVNKSGARIKLTDGTNQINMGLWDGANYRFEGDANRPMFFTSYQGNINFGISGGTTMTIQNGNVGIGTTSPGAELQVVGRIKTTRIVSSNIILGNIRSNITTTSYLLLVDLNITAGFSLAGKVNAASYTTWNVSDIYVRKNYNATTGYATITGISKSGSTLSVVDISHSSGRFIALKLTGDPEVDVMWAGYRLDALFQGSGEVTTLTSGVTENSVYASY